MGLVGNPDKVSCADVVREAAMLIRRAGRGVWADSATAGLAGKTSGVCATTAELSRKVDLLLVFGGDGTMLKAAREVNGSQTPILGVNTGSLGFLTATSASDLKNALSRVWRGEISFESRSLLEATGRTSTGLLRQQALNDFVISRGIASRLIELEVKIDGEALTSYRCDGLIISSPTGSTAYSLAAGGAVVFPTAEVLAITPICPHTLSNRSLIVPLRSKIEVKVISLRPETILSADGQVITQLRSGEVLTIRKAGRKARLTHLAGSSFCETLRLKLHWRGGTF